jgi:hypothetical protein
VHVIAETRSLDRIASVLAANPAPGRGGH